jgi:hypothetical protein
MNRSGGTDKSDPSLVGNSAHTSMIIILISVQNSLEHSKIGNLNIQIGNHLIQGPTENVIVVSIQKFRN